jgi:hypothetical protein
VWTPSFRSGTVKVQRTALGLAQQEAHHGRTDRSRLRRPAGGGSRSHRAEAARKGISRRPRGCGRRDPPARGQGAAEAEPQSGQRRRRLWRAFRCVLGLARRAVVLEPACRVRGRRVARGRDRSAHRLARRLRHRRQLHPVPERNAAAEQLCPVRARPQGPAREGPGRAEGCQRAHSTHLSRPNRRPASRPRSRDRQRLNRIPRPGRTAAARFTGKAPGRRIEAADAWAGLERKDCGRGPAGPRTRSDSS